MAGAQGESGLSKTLLSSSRQRQLNSEQEASLPMDAKRRAEYDLLADLKVKGQPRTTPQNSSMGSAAAE